MKERDVGDDQIRGVKGSRLSEVGHPSDLRYSVGYSGRVIMFQHCVSLVRRFSAFLQEVNETWKMVVSQTQLCHMRCI